MRQNSAPPTVDSQSSTGAAAAPAAPQATAPLAAHRAAAAKASNLTRLVIAAAFVAAVVLTIFCAQNTGGSNVKFLVWGWQGAPLFVVILASVGLGIAIGSVFVWLRLARYSAERRILGRRS